MEQTPESLAPPKPNSLGPESILEYRCCLSSPTSSPIKPTGNPGLHYITLSRALVVKFNLIAKLRRHTEGIVAKSIASCILRNENKELIVRHRQAELTIDIVVILRRLIAGTAGAVEGCASVDARGGHITAILAGDRVAGTAWGRRLSVRGDQRSGADDHGQGGDVHLDRRLGLSIDL